MIKIKDVAKVSKGYSFRKGLDLTVDGDIFVILGRDVLKHRVIGLDDLGKIHSPVFRKKPPYLKNKDVLLTIRGSFNSSVFISDTDNSYCLASDTVLIIRLNNQNTYLSEFVSIFLNSHIMQKEFYKLHSQSSVALINKYDIEEIKLPKLTLKKQEQIINIFNAQSTLDNLMKQKMEAENKIINTILKQAIKGDL